MFKSKPTIQDSKDASSPIPKGFEWVLDIVKAVNFPHIGLPVNWEKTQDKHTKIAFDPS